MPTLQFMMSTYFYNACKDLSYVSNANKSDYFRAFRGKQFNLVSLLVTYGEGQWKMSL